MDAANYSVTGEWSKEGDKDVYRAQGSLNGSVVASEAVYFAPEKMSTMTAREPEATWRAGFATASQRFVLDQARRLLKDADVHVDVLRVGESVLVTYRSLMAPNEYRTFRFMLEPKEAHRYITSELKGVVHQDDVTATYCPATGGTLQRPASRKRDDVLEFLKERLDPQEFVESHPEG